MKCQPPGMWLRGQRIFAPRLLAGHGLDSQRQTGWLPSALLI